MRTQYLTSAWLWYSSPQPTILTEWYPVLDPVSKLGQLYTPDLYMKKSLVTFITAVNILVKYYNTTRHNNFNTLPYYIISKVLIKNFYDIQFH